MRLRFRIVLPTTLGCVALALMLWDVHNQRACVWCDTPSSIWPYRAPTLLLQAINVPAFVAASLFFLLSHVPVGNARYPVLLALICLWWWWFGTRIDFGLLGLSHYRRPKLVAIMLYLLAVALLCAGAEFIRAGFHQWAAYKRIHPLLLVPAACSTLWSAGLAAGCVLAAGRLLRGEFRSRAERTPQPPVLAYGLAFVTLIAIATSAIGYAREEKVDPDSCVASSDHGCIHGTIADNNAKLLKGIEVDVLPVNKTDDARWSATKREWTDAKGRYSVNGVAPGEYFVVVHYYGAPDSRQPFPTTFYPGVESETNAGRVAVARNSKTILNQLTLVSLPLATIDIEVVWPDGAKPKWSDLLFHNVSYSDQAVIGDEAPEIEDGAGKFTLPKGFIYSASASVQCDAGAVIETRESRPLQQVNVSDAATPRKLTFTLPGPPCKLWRPK